MKVQLEAMVIGAQFYDIPDEKTGQINRYTAVFFIQPAEAGKDDRVGQVPGKFKSRNSEIIRKLRARQLPALFKLDAEITVNAKGESRTTVLDIIVPEQPAKAA